MMKRFVTLTTLAALSGALVVTPAFSAAYMKFDGVKGEITANPTATSARNRGGWIEIESWSMGASAPQAAQGCSGEAGPGQLTAAAARGMPRPSAQRLPVAQIEVEQPDGSLLKYELRDVLISSVTPTRGSSRPMESMSLNYTKISWSRTNCQGLLVPAVQKAREAATR